MDTKRNGTDQIISATFLLNSPVEFYFWYFERVLVRVFLAAVFNLRGPMFCAMLELERC